MTVRQGLLVVFGVIVLGGFLGALTSNRQVPTVVSNDSTTSKLIQNKKTPIQETEPVPQPSREEAIPDNSEPNTPDTEEEEDDSEEDGVASSVQEKEIITIINARRVNNGLIPLKEDTTLKTLAKVDYRAWSKNDYDNLINLERSIHINGVRYKAVRHILVIPGGTEGVTLEDALRSFSSNVNTEYSLEKEFTKVGVAVGTFQNAQRDGELGIISIILYAHPKKK